MSVLDIPRDRLDVELPEEVPSRAEVHRWVGCLPVDRAGRCARDAVSLTTELVDNAYRHAARPRRITLRLLRDRGVLRVEVSDGSPSLLPVLARHALPVRGLQLVNRLAVNWGCEQHREHKTVWAETPVC